jgi:tetratricopeptide (TPR) repeat protein
MKYKLLFVLGASLLVFCSCTDGGKLSSDYRRQGDEAYIQHNYGEAERLYKAAVELAEKNGADASVIIALRSLAQVYLEQGKDDEVEVIYKRRLELAKEVWANDPKNLAAVYDDLAIFYLLKDRYIEAAPLIEQSISLKQTTFGASNPKTIESIQFYVLLLRKKGLDKEADQLEARIKENKSQNIHWNFLPNRGTIQAV